MTPVQSRDYRVCQHECEVYDIILAAGSADEAIELARALYDEQGHEAFQYQVFEGHEDFTAEELRR